MTTLVTFNAGNEVNEQHRRVDEEAEAKCCKLTAHLKKWGTKQSHCFKLHFQPPKKSFKIAANSVVDLDRYCSSTVWDFPKAAYKCAVPAQNLTIKA